MRLPEGQLEKFTFEYACYRHVPLTAATSLDDDTLAKFLVRFGAGLRKLRLVLSHSGHLS